MEEVGDGGSLPTFTLSKWVVNHEM